MPKVVSSRPYQSGYDNFVRKFGRIVGLPVTSTAVIWDGGNGYDGWLNDITAETEEDISIVSSSALDVYVDGLGGNAGAELCQFTGQGKDGIEKTYVIQLNGQTPVLLSTTDPGILFQTIYTAQTYGGPKDPTALLRGNIGTITISSKTSGKVMAIILPRLARTQMMLWRCPLDHYAEFKAIDVYPVSGKPAKIELLFRSALTLGSWVNAGQVDVSGEDDINVKNAFPDYIAPGTDLVIVITSQNQTVDCSAQMWIEKKPINNYGAE